MGKQRRYTDEQQFVILQEVEENGLAVTLRKHSMYAKTIYQWKERLQQFAQHERGKRSTAELENRRLQAEIQQLKEIGSISFVLRTVGFSKSTFYYKPRPGQRGRQARTFSRHAAGHIVSNEEILAAVRWLLAQEFVDYGYVKVAVWLQRKGLVINRKKVYRLMRAEKLLLPKPSRDRSGKTWVKDLLPITQRAFDYLEFDIKYIQ